MNELVFHVTEDPDGGFVAEAVGAGISTQGDSLDEQREMVREAVEAYYFDEAKPTALRLRFIREELISLS